MKIKHIFLIDCFTIFYSIGDCLFDEIIISLPVSSAPKDIKTFGISKFVSNNPRTLIVRPAKVQNILHNEKKIVKSIENDSCFDCNTCKSNK